MKEYANRDKHDHKWSVGLCNAACRRPAYCCFSMVCMPCSNMYVRKQALKGDLSRYRCCQGYYCGCCTRCLPCQSRCPSCCLCIEAHACPNVSVMSTRHFIQDELHIKNTACEACCFNCMMLINCVTACCMSEDNPIAQVVHCCVHTFLCVTMPCMLTQEKYELDKQTSELEESLVPPPGVKIERT